MSDGSKRRDGAEYKKKARIKKEEQEQVIRKLIKIDSLLKNISRISVDKPEFLIICTDTLQYGKYERDLNFSTQQRQQLSVEQSSLKKKRIFMFLTKTR